MEPQKATFGAGCFWGVEETFRKLKGVTDTAVGYAGGTKENPTYEDVCTDQTGHAEVVKIDFDPAVLSFRDLLKIFFSIHDPTTRDRQGNDVGTQYRSVIFPQNKAQREGAIGVVEELSKAKLWNEPIVTEIAGAEPFYPAERYHQEYFARNGRQPYCQMVVAPKVAKFRKEYFDRLKRSGA